MGPCAANTKTAPAATRRGGVLPCPQCSGLGERPRAAYTPPLHATGPCAVNTKTAPAGTFLRRGQDPALQTSAKSIFFMVCVSFGRRGGLQAARAAMPCRERSDDAAAFPFPVGRGRTPPWGFALPGMFRAGGTPPGGARAAPTRNGTLRGKYKNRACRNAPRRGFALPGMFRAGGTPPGGVHAAPTRNGALRGKYKKRVCRIVPAAGSRPRPTNKNHKLQLFVRPPLHATEPCAANTKTAPAATRRGGVRPRPTNKNHKLQRFVRPPRVRSQYSPMLAPGRPVHSSAR